MVTRTTPFSPGTPCWVDLFTSDPDGAKAFYGAVFGWEFADGGEEFGGYVTARSDGHQVAGIMRNSGEAGTPDAWSTYLATADIDADVAKASAAGAQVVAPAMQVGPLGKMAVLIDPAGGLVGLWEAGQHTGFEKYADVGAVAWSEHHSKQFGVTREFYRSVFGWDYDVTSDTDDFRYLTAKVGYDEVAGLMDSAGFLPPEVPTHWAVYLGVADADEAAAAVERAGGTVVRAPEDTPFGRIADVTDPTGVAFKLHSSKLAQPEPEPRREPATSDAS